jgi:hypothetical protein
MLISQKILSRERVFTKDDGKIPAYRIAKRHIRTLSNAIPGLIELFDLSRFRPLGAATMRCVAQVKKDIDQTSMRDATGLALMSPVMRPAQHPTPFTEHRGSLRSGDTLVLPAQILKFD